jgi:hypothetical protein
MELLMHLKDFASEISRGIIEIYNEPSIQYELAIYLRGRLGNEYKIQLERNINYFNLYKENHLKKEMDIVIFTSDKKEKHSIELKFPTQGQYPEQMFKVCKDVKFLEQLIKSGFDECYFIMFANDPLFYKSKGDNGIYEMFRSEKLIRGEIRKPTGKEDERVQIAGEYRIEWQTLKGDLKCFIIEVKS